MAPVKTATATILAGQSLSNSVDLTTTIVSMIVAPDDWTAANISLVTSADNVTFSNMVDRAGKEIMITVVPGAAMLVDPEVTSSTVYLKIRSGSMSKAIAQEADRSFVLVLTS